MYKFLRSVPSLGPEGDFDFPPPESAHDEGILCLGGNLSPGILLSAYRRGIFPWYDEHSPIIWWSPDPRFVVLPETFHIPVSAGKTFRKRRFSLSLDRKFPEVIQACANAPRKDQDGTWIVPEMRAAYTRLHQLGYAHSVEVWEDDALVGGLYGVAIGKAFFGESMFSKVSGASRVGFLSLAACLFDRGFEFIDSQVHTDYVASMGGVEIPRAAYLERLKKAVAGNDTRGDWGVLLSPLEAPVELKGAPSASFPADSAVE